MVELRQGSPPDVNPVCSQLQLSTSDCEGLRVQLAQKQSVEQQRRLDVLAALTAKEREWMHDISAALQSHSRVSLRLLLGALHSE